MKVKRTEWQRWIVLYPSGALAPWSLSETRKGAISHFMDGVEGMAWATHFRPRGYRCVKCTIKINAN